MEMQSVWMAIRPGPTVARILAMQGPEKTLLKANLDPNPAHPRALPYLLEAIAMWQGQKVRAALCVDESARSFGTTHYPDVLIDAANTPLYDLEWAPVRARRQRDNLRGLGDFRDLRQLVLFEVAR